MTEDLADSPRGRLKREEVHRHERERLVAGSSGSKARVGGIEIGIHSAEGHQVFEARQLEAGLRVEILWFRNQKQTREIMLFGRLSIFHGPNKLLMLMSLPR